MKINIDNHLEKRRKTRYWLIKEIGIAYPTIKKLDGSDTEGTKFETLEK